MKILNLFRNKKVPPWRDFPALKVNLFKIALVLTSFIVATCNINVNGFMCS